MTMSCIQRCKVFTLSFSGAGHLLPYHLGAVIALKEKEQISKSIVAVSGSSSGAIAATIFVNFASVENIKDYAERFITDGGRAMFHLQQMMLDESVTIQSTKQSLHIGTTRCSDGSLQLFNFPAGSSSSDQISRDHLVRCIQASCKIPSHFHPSDVLPSRWPSTYPEDDGIRIDGKSFCDGGIAAPAPPTPIDNNEKGTSFCRIVVSPIAGSNNDENTIRISPRDESFKFPIDIKCRGGFTVHPSLQNIKAMQVSAGVSATPAILREWYKRGSEDVGILLADAN